MSAPLFSALLLHALSASLGKYVHVPTPKSWPEAQAHCRSRHTDLAPMGVPHDFERFYQVVPDNGSSVWIGLVRDPHDATQWMWSGGGNVSRTFWEPGQPDMTNGFSGYIKNHKWYDAVHRYEKTFACFNVTVVMEKKTWEGALEHCRRHHKDLASVASHTEMLLIQTELEESGATQGVWTGLRMMSKDWVWTDGQPLEYQAWGAQGRPACPTVKQCGALQMKATASGHADYDAEKFPDDAVDEVIDTINNMELDDDWYWVTDWEWATEGDWVDEMDWETEWEWAAEDCSEENYFICY